MNGGTAVAKQLAACGVRHVFTVPGETFLSALDGLYDQSTIQTIVCRHEGGAAMMAEASAKMTGKPGVVFVTRAPGLANAISGLVVARHDHTPLVLLVGLPKLATADRGDLQLSEFENLMGAFAKSVTLVRQADRIPQTLARAFQVATSGQPGVVAVGLPEDILNSACRGKIVKPRTKKRHTPSPGDMRFVQEALNAARAPMIVVGGGPWGRKTQQRIEQFAARCDLPIATAFRCQDFVDNRHICYVGHLGIAVQSKLATALRTSDVVLVIGANLGDVTTGGYALIKAPHADQTVIHVHPGEDTIGRAVTADHAIVCSPKRFAKALRSVKTPQTRRWIALRQKLREAYVSSLHPQPTPGAVQLEKIVAHVSQSLPDKAIVTNGAGNYAQFVHRYFQYKRFRTCLAPAAGSMGYGLPAAIAAKLIKPGRPVVAFAGDGCFMMTMQELATAVQYGINIIVIIANNGVLGTIRMHQEQRFPDRVIATTLTNPDFVAVAKSFGAAGYKVSATEDFETVFDDALRCGKPAVIELEVDAEAITPDETLTNLRKNTL